MLLVIADTSPIRYLIQIDQIDLLVSVFETNRNAGSLSFTG